MSLFSTSCAAFDGPITADEAKELDNIDGVRNPKCKIFFLNIRHSKNSSLDSYHNGKMI